MPHLPRLSVTLLALLFCCAASHAQNSYPAQKPSPYSTQPPNPDERPAQPAYPDQRPYPAHPPYPDDNWVPNAMMALGENASFHTDFTLDSQMLHALANGFYGDPDGERIVASLRSISLHIYHYPGQDMYDPAALEAVRRAYDARGWTHLVASRDHIEDPETGRTDLWINFRNTNVEGMAVLIQNPSTLNLIVINGTLSPLDLLHLRGHFGIPRFQGDRFVPERH